MNRPLKCFLPAMLCVSSMVRAADLEATRGLAAELSLEDNHEAAGVEYRRLALETENPADKAGYYVASAWEYLQKDDCEVVQKMLDRAEDNDPSIQDTAVLLRGESAFASGRHDQAAFYFESIAAGAPDTAAALLASRRLAHLMIIDGNYDDARERLVSCEEHNQQGLQALDAYLKGRNRHPRLGGVLGLVPGLGYAYSGEFANALRSLILNSIFIYGMVDTADNEQWGAFSAITFFELTWYTGSVYGGIDAAHRYNRSRLNTCLKAVDGSAGMKIDLSRVPVVSLSFDF